MFEEDILYRIIFRIVEDYGTMYYPEVYDLDNVLSADFLYLDNARNGIINITPELKNVILSVAEEGEKNIL